MARTKPTEALKKFLRAERTRLRQRELDPDFLRDLEPLEAIAKRLAPSGLIPISKLSEMSEKDLLPTDDETAFHDLAERFKEKWNFQPRFTDDGKVELSIRSPVSWKTSPATGETIEVTRRYKHHAPGDVDALEKYYRSLRERARAKKGRPAAKKRKRIGTDEERLEARKLRAQGKTFQQIAQNMYPDECRAALKRNPSAEKELRPLAAQYMEPPHNLTWPEAEKRAALELGLDMRPRSEKIETLTRKIRRYLLPDK